MIYGVILYTLFFGVLFNNQILPLAVSFFHSRCILIDPLREFRIASPVLCVVIVVTAFDVKAASDVDNGWWRD